MGSLRSPTSSSLPFFGIALRATAAAGPRNRQGALTGPVGFPYTSTQMWPFRRAGSDSTHDDRLATLSRRLDDVESKCRTLGLEWQDVLDRLERLAGRVAKRGQRDGAALLAPGDAPEAPPATPAPPAGSRALADVLKRRSVRAPPGGNDAVLRR